MKNIVGEATMYGASEMLKIMKLHLSTMHFSLSLSGTNFAKSEII